MYLFIGGTHRQRRRQRGNGHLAANRDQHVHGLDSPLKTRVAAQGAEVLKDGGAPDLFEDAGHPPAQGAVRFLEQRAQLGMPIDAVDPRDERAEQGQDLSVGTTQGTDVGQEQRLVDHPFGQRAKDEATVGLVTRITRQPLADEHAQQALDVVARERGHFGQERVYLGWPRPAGCSKSPKQLLGVHGTSSGRKSVGRACATRDHNYRMFAGFLQSQGDAPAPKLAQRDAVARVECLSTTESTEDTEPEGQGSDSPCGRSAPRRPRRGPMDRSGFACDHPFQQTLLGRRTEGSLWLHQA